jgi:hypothetical protein
MTSAEPKALDAGLRVYMNDQLALGVLWRDVARGAARKNDGSELGLALTEVAEAIAEDVDTFESMMRRLGIPRNRIKPALAAVAARAVRLKLSGMTGGASLSRFEALDFLVIGIVAKKLLWATLRDCADLRDRLPEVDFDELIGRAERQHSQLEPFRESTAREALGGGPAA